MQTFYEDEFILHLLQEPVAPSLAGENPYPEELQNGVLLFGNDESDDGHSKCVMRNGEGSSLPLVDDSSFDDIDL